MQIACKFGGTSLASSQNIRRCAEIIRSNAARRYIVVSAPGKKDGNSKKVTDLLYDCYRNRFNDECFEKSFSIVKEIFGEIASLLGKDDLNCALNEIRAQIKTPEANLDFVLSRGEYLNAKIIASYLGYEFLDAADFVRFKNGELDLSATMRSAETIDRDKCYVIPGFYGTDEAGHIKTFSRGGSDITGSIVARVFRCDLYENWTDVDGIHVCDPKIVADSKKVSQISFRELREMSYMGASVLHAETLFPLYEEPIPILIKSSFSPQDEGTLILKKRTEISDRETITCITGKDDYTCIQISKTMLDKQLGFVKKVTSVFEEYDINISHTHSGLDNLCFFVEKGQYTKISFNDFLTVLGTRIAADKVQGYDEIALLAVIGHNLSGKVGILATIFSALKKSGISVKTIYQSVSECNVIIGVESRVLRDGIQAIYHALISE